MQYLFLFLICFAATTLGAISGIGGGVIIKPVMDAVSMIRGRGGDAKVDPQRGTALAVGSALGGTLGKCIFDMIKTFFGQ